ncbi:conserved hypothetical protein [Paecilomyces variotii No. 5]|uniref:Uncharacterized protein n=1 Tax=Byssochlamys spectabilis (strain No. 5 / NBRC 109023) TaxID=1356009 RepID=V5FV06_BYSSN|nr:conserved hypothetical protein [Paecilomyces variotii No. 5]
MPDIPGSFFADTPVAPKLDLAGAHTQLFQTPLSASASSSLYRSISNSRKRQRRSYAETQVSRESRSLWDSQSELVSPAPLVNTDYHLAGGGEPKETIFEKHETGAELDYRPNRYREHTPSLDKHGESVSTADGINRKREHSSSPSTASPKANTGWGRAVFSVVGGVAGKVWDFCWSGAFRGFYAGGGQGYKMTVTTSSGPEQSTWEAVSHPDDVFASETRVETPVPGQFPDDHAHGRNSDPDVLPGNWVLVPEEPTSRETSPIHSARKVPRKNTTLRRPAVMPRFNKRQILSPGRPSTSYSTPTKTPTRLRGSPAAHDSQRYAAKVRRQELEEDASIRRLNKQLKAMIKEGKEALGTRIEIEDDLDTDYD